MEQSTKSSSSSRGSEQRERLLLGCFFQLHPHYHGSRYAITQPSFKKFIATQPINKFVSMSPLGNDLNEGKWGSLDESLEFLGQDAYVVASSNGFLLCTSIVDATTWFIICNPVTREFRFLPEPPKSYRYVSVAFICKGDYEANSSMATVNYEVFVAGLTASETNNVSELQIFSSETGEWDISCIESPLPFRMGRRALPGIVLEEMVYWLVGGHFLAYSRSSERVEVMEVPYSEDGDHISPDDVVFEDWLAASNGKLSYACSLRHRLEVWVLQDCVGGRANWNLKHSVTHRRMIQHNPTLLRRYDSSIGCVIKNLHPSDPDRVMVYMGGNMYWYDAVAGNMEKIRTSFASADLYLTFPYEWPSNPPQ
ncbi:hypothetical protein OROGR_007491 [Orobanche gracilis]